MSSRYSRRKGNNDNTNERYKNNCNEGTAARTRPFSFDEIMLRRKIRNLSGDLIDVKDSTGGPSGLLEDVIDDAERFKSKCHRQNKESPRVSEKCISEVSMRSCVRKKDTSLKEESISNCNSKNNYGSENKLMVKPQDDDVSYKEKNYKFEIRSHIRKKISELSTDDSESESREKSSRDFVVNDRYAIKSKQKFDYEPKRRHRSAYEDKIKDKGPVKINPRKWHSSEFSANDVRGEFQTDGNEESRIKQKQYRSRELLKKRDRYGSVSPRAHKSTTSYHGRDSDLSSQTIQKKRGRQDFDIDKSKMSGNGSSSNYRRHGVPASGLGGYSPRKRKSDAAVKTPSPIRRSPEKKSVGWDLPPSGTQSNLPVLVISNADSCNQHDPSSMNEMTSVVPANINVTIPSGSSHNTSSSLKGVSVDLIQLTQATRPLRRVYVENVPASASEKSLMECLNDFLLSTRSGHILGTQPCISCIIQKERGHAFVEFLTPEDASAALSFDGNSFLGSILKIRRPKDFVEVTTDVQEKSASAAAVIISDTVMDSPYKIFIGGISELLSSEMIMRIAIAFGPLKAFSFQIGDTHNGPSAFLEYVDQSVTLKACAGLNGLKLGGKTLTVVQALPNASQVLENAGSPPFYGIPEHAKPLLERPTQILNLKNVLDPAMLSTLSDAELEEILEDIRLECARFGAIKTLNVVKQGHLKHHEDSLEIDCDAKNVEEREEAIDAECVGDGNKRSETELETGIKEEVSMEEHCCKEGKGTGDGVCNLEVGCVVVEYRRSESCCMAAHGLHGRVFGGDRIVSVSYVASNVFKAWFPSLPS